VRTGGMALPMALIRKRSEMEVSRNCVRRLRNADGVTVVDLVIGVAVTPSWPRSPCRTCSRCCSDIA
jgi:hypothetical protein